MFRKISENAESDSDGKNLKFTRKNFSISKKTFLGDDIQKWRISFDQLRDHKLFFMAFSKPLSR